MTHADEFVRWARAQVGLPYSAYRDCSGFTAAAYRQIGITIPEGSVAQYQWGKPISEGFLPGDLAFWDTFGPSPGHVALYIGNGRVIHALNEQRGIIESDLSANMGGPFMGIRRIFLPADSSIVENPEPIEEQPRSKRRRRRNRRKERP